MVKVLSGQGNGSLSRGEREVVLNLGPLITQVKTQLVARGLTIADRIPTVNATFPLFAAPEPVEGAAGLPAAHHAEVGAAVPVARAARGGRLGRPQPRHGLIGAGLGLAASMLVLGIALTIARGVYLNSVPRRCCQATRPACCTTR